MPGWGSKHCYRHPCQVRPLITDAQRGNSLHCKAENSIPIPNFYVRPKHILSAKLAQFVRYFWFVPSLVRDVRHTVSRLDLINKASQKFCLMISVSSASSFLSLRYSLILFVNFYQLCCFCHFHMCFSKTTLLYICHLQCIPFFFFCKTQHHK